MHKHQTLFFFKELVPSVLLLFKIRKGIRLWHAGITDHSIWLTNTRLKKSIEEEWTDKLKYEKLLYKRKTANTTAIWQQVAPTNYHLQAVHFAEFSGEKKSTKKPEKWTTNRKMNRQKEHLA